LARWGLRFRVKGLGFGMLIDELLPKARFFGEVGLDAAIQQQKILRSHAHPAKRCIAVSAWDLTLILCSGP
jgi:hypothetical protein